MVSLSNFYFNNFFTKSFRPLILKTQQNQCWEKERWYFNFVDFVFNNYTVIIARPQGVLKKIMFNKIFIGEKIFDNIISHYTSSLTLDLKNYKTKKIMKLLVNEMA